MHSFSGENHAAAAARPVRLGLSFLAVLVALLAHTSPARADGRTENAAKQLETKAMQEDYLATDFDKALEKLNQAASKCGTDKCASMVRAQIKRDIGVVQSAKQNREAAVAAFAEALRVDSGVVLDPDTRTKEVDAAWAEAKKQAGSSGGGGGGGGGGGATNPAGDFTVSHAAATLARTPLPIYVEYTGTEQIAKVVLKYKGFGMTEWKTLEMKSMDKGWGAEIPCLDVTQGDVVYYVQGFNSANDPIATSGDRNNPYKTSAKQGYTGELPHFPNREPPKQCQEAGDCPPDFPGCNKKPEETPGAGGEGGESSSLKPGGADCEENSECKSGTCGKDKTCTADESSGKRPKFWIGLDLQYDFINIASASQVCLLQQAPNPAVPVNTQGYYCTNQAGSDYPSRDPSDPDHNANIDPNLSDKVAGGFAPGTFRVSASFDYAATTALLVGARVGYVVNSYTGNAAKTEGKAFAPVHLEVRGTYLLGPKDPLLSKAPSLYVSLGAGVSQFSAGVNVTTVGDGKYAGLTAPVKAWEISGPVFLAAGVGIRVPATPRLAFMAGPRIGMAFGAATVVVLSPELSMQYGF